MPATDDYPSSLALPSRPGRPSGKRPRSSRSPKDYAQVDPQILFEVVLGFLHPSGKGKFSARKLAAHLQSRFGSRVIEELGRSPTRESIYPLLRAALQQCVTLNPPLAVLTAWRLIDRYGLDPAKHEVDVVDVLDGPAAAAAVAERAAERVLLALRSLGELRHVAMGLGRGETVYRAIKGLAGRLRAELRPADFVIHPLACDERLVPDHPLTFARTLEATGRNQVRVHLGGPPQGKLHLAVVDAGFAPAPLPEAEITVVLAAPGGDGADLGARLADIRGHPARVVVVCDLLTADNLLHHTVTS